LQIVGPQLASGAEAVPTEAAAADDTAEQSPETMAASVPATLVAMPPKLPSMMHNETQ
jgi:hypothetical protein